MLLLLASTTLCGCCSAACMLSCTSHVIRKAGCRICIPVVVSPPGQGVCSIVVGRLLQLIALGDMDEVHLGSNVLFTKLVHSEVPVSCAHHLWPCTSMPFSCALVYSFQRILFRLDSCLQCCAAAPCSVAWRPAHAPCNERWCTHQGAMCRAAGRSLGGESR